MQVDPIKPKLKPPGTKRLKLKYDMLLSNYAFKFNSRRYNLNPHLGPGDVVGERSLFTGEVAMADVVAVSPVRAVALPRGALTDGGGSGGVGGGGGGGGVFGFDTLLPHVRSTLHAIVAHRALRRYPAFQRLSHDQAGAYTRQLLSSTSPLSDTKYTLDIPRYPLIPHKHPLNNP
jgi:CRP-like cAMP-binding protein